MSFIVEELGMAAKQKMMTTKVWQDDCPVSLQQLVSVKVLHYNFQGEEKEGELIVHRKMAQNTLKIFRELKQVKFSIEQIKPIENFAGDDELSMSHNNSSCFNYRKIANSKLVSLHSYGLAIDINPLQNPVITFEHGKPVVRPTQGMEYLNRQNQRPGMIEPVVKIFISNGFSVWGGNWQDPIDYHHFQIDRLKINNLDRMI